MNNFIKTRGWLELALWDIDGFFTAKEQNDFGHAVYYLQQSTEKGCKAIISFLGIEVKHTHFPAEEIIKNQIVNNTEEVNRLGLNEEHICVLNQIISYAIPLEEEETKPRYGEELSDRIVLPTEIYTEEKSKELFEKGHKFWQTVLEFFQRFDIAELKEVLTQLSSYAEKFK